MFSSTHFLIHDTVQPQAADDIASEIQGHGGRICFDPSKADVIVVDTERCAESLPITSCAELVHHTWVGLCLKYGRRLPYTYQDAVPTQSETPTRTEADASITEGEAVRMDSSGCMTTSPMPANMPEATTLEDDESQQHPGILPLPSPSILLFRASPGRAFPRDVREYFSRFLTAMWTLDPVLSVEAIGKHITKVLPKLSFYSLRSFSYRYAQDAHDARQQAAAVIRTRRGPAVRVDIGDEMTRLLEAVAAMGRSRPTSSKTGSARAPVQKPTKAAVARVSSPSKTLHPGGNRARILRSGSRVQALLNAPGRPPMPSDEYCSLESKYDFFDTVLKWALEQQPSATTASISAFVDAISDGKVAVPSLPMHSSAVLISPSVPTAGVQEFVPECNTAGAVQPNRGGRLSERDNGKANWLGSVGGRNEEAM
ncbi:hypothetical protein AURDEDRAFT_172811 [Auricularia subglabra TFB-10046 SS5]|nr:hypothetical protein AURDEDRAFT_172811 [Auricularia subglabra TFB-10046 SS5]